MAITKICKLSGVEFTISDKEIQYCQDHDIPLPTISPIERVRSITSFDNAIYLYNGVCALSGQSILTSVPPELDHSVYSPDLYISDQWDPLGFGQDYDFSRPFFEQFGTLFQKVPLPSRYVTLSTLENSEYVNGITGAKNCYLIFNATNCEDCFYGRVLNTCKNVVDSICVQNSELCYGCINVQNGYNLVMAENCSNCQDSYFLFNCKNLKHCFGCSNLSGKEYYFENQACTPEEYDKKLQSKNLGSFSSWSHELDRYRVQKQSFTRKFMQGNQSDVCSGNYINQSQNCSDCFFVLDAQDVSCGIRIVKAKDVYSSAFAVNNSEQIYSSHGGANNAYNLKWCVCCPNNVRDLEYCIHTSLGSHDCFGCIGLKKKEYCILNKQYTKDAYFELVSKIKAQMKAQGEYGELFPASLSPQYYNESYAMEFAPLDREEALKRGYKWKDDVAVGNSAIAEIPDNIADVEDTILNTILTCAETHKKYRLTKAELDFYRRFCLPIPRVAPLARIRHFSQILEMKPLLGRSCSSCSIALQSVYKDEAILCESCYQNSLV